MPFAAAWSRPSSDQKQCCAAMSAALAFDCDQHTDPFECVDALVIYNEVFDEYGLPVHDGGPSYVLIRNCPWCGSRLPPSQRNRWFEETEALGIADEEMLPAEYLSAAWRVSRNR